MAGDREEAPVLYEEHLPFPLALLAAVVLVFAAGSMLVLFFLQVTGGPLGSRPAPDFVYLLMFFFMAALTWLVAGFRRLSIRATTGSITLRCGLFRWRVHWEDVEDCFVDNAPGLRYGGWGVRLARFGGQWRLAFNTPGVTGVVLRLRRGRVRQVMFSTASPDTVLGIVRRQAGLAAG